LNKIKITIFNTFHKSNGNGNGKDSCRDIRHKKDVQGINGIVMLDLVPIDVHMRLRPSTKNMVLLKGQNKRDTNMDPRKNNKNPSFCMFSIIMEMQQFENKNMGNNVI